MKKILLLCLLPILLHSQSQYRFFINNINMPIDNRGVLGAVNIQPEGSNGKFDDITFDEAYKRGLNVMDLTSITMCRENNLPIIVFDMNKEGNLLKLVSGEKIGTLVHN